MPQTIKYIYSLWQKVTKDNSSPQTREDYSKGVVQQQGLISKTANIWVQ